MTKGSLWTSRCGCQRRQGHGRFVSFFLQRKKRLSSRTRQQIKKSRKGLASRTRAFLALHTAPCKKRKKRKKRLSSRTRQHIKERAGVSCATNSAFHHCAKHSARRAARTRQHINERNQGKGRPSCSAALLVFNTAPCRHCSTALNTAPFITALKLL